MSDLYRRVPVSPTSRLESYDAPSNNFCVCRLLADVALVSLRAVADLQTAHALMGRMAARVPGSYLIFSRQTHRVLAKVNSRSPSRAPA